MKQLVKKCFKGASLSLSHSLSHTRYVFFTDPSTPIQKFKVTCNLSSFITKYFFTLTQVGFQIGIFTFTQIDLKGSYCSFT